MMLSTIANPQKRMMLHKYFEEQREIAAKKVETLVRAQAILIMPINANNCRVAVISATIVQKLLIIVRSISLTLTCMTFSVSKPTILLTSMLFKEHAMLVDMKLALGPDLRGPNFAKTFEPPEYFTNIKM